MAEDAKQKRIAITCQGGGSHAAFCAGVLSDLLDTAETQKNFAIHGLSGTSGGAICAVLAWYGLLRNSTPKPGGGLFLGSPDKYLKAFWKANSTQNAMESLYNSWVALLDEIPFTIKTSPYSWTWRIMEWQRSIIFSQRPEFIRFELLLSKYIDFNHIEVLVKPFVILKEARAQLNKIMVQNIVGDVLSINSSYSLQDFKDRVSDAVKGINDLPDFIGVKALISDVRDQSKSANTLDQLVNILEDYARLIPLLVVGSVDVKSGEFKAFSSKDGPITLDMMQASAAIPELFRAVIIDESFYWDGLFSQNPPITNFVSATDAASEKPDEIWVLQINPQGRDEEPSNVSAISDRRNELSCNLSLNQEIAAIQMISRLVEDPGTQLPSQQVKRIDVFRIPMNEKAFEAEHRRDLDLASKVDRHIDFTWQLISHGRQQGRIFRSIRHFIQEVWNRPAIATDATAPPAYQPIGRLHQIFNHLYFTIDATEIRGYSQHSAGAVLGWRGRGVHGDNNYEITGIAKLTLDLNASLFLQPTRCDLFDIKVEPI